MKSILSLIEAIKTLQGVTLNEPLDQEELTHFEKRIKYRLPKDYRIFLKLSNGLDLLYDLFYGVYPDKPEKDLYHIYLRETREVDNPMMEYLLPILPDGFGNHYCLDLKTSDGESCAVVFWQHDYTYTVNDRPDIDNTSFGAFLEERLTDIQEDLEDE